MTFFKAGEGSSDAGTAEGAGGAGGFGFPKIPEKFLKGHMAKLAEELVKDIERVLNLQTREDEYTPSPRAKEYLKQCINLVKGQ
jgi:hypothetical protein